MKIVFDAQPLLEHNQTGVSYYETGLLNSLLKHFPQDQYGIDVFTFKNRQEKLDLISNYAPELDVQECRWFSGTLYRILTLFFPVPSFLFFRKKRDITHFCNFVIPLGVNGKTIVTIHDLAFLVYPETIRKKTMFMLQKGMKHSLKRANAIVADSEFTKREIMKYYDISSDKVHVVPCGVDTEEFYREEDKSVISKVKRKYGIQGAYFLYLGTLEPRKNIEGLLHAYKEFLEKRRDSSEPLPMLVVAGGKGWMFDTIFRKVEELSLQKKVVFTGYVDDFDKRTLLSAALAFCFPSFYEGFGMPPLEAMACGTPVIVSNVASLPEVVGDAALKVDPYRIDEISDAMGRLWEDNLLCLELQEKGKIQVEKYSWENAAGKLHEVYQILGVRK